jgi:hypothetical protein
LCAVAAQEDGKPVRPAPELVFSKRDD